jgi:hypothetical protein
LNYLWRELTRVRIILLDRVQSGDWAPYHLDFCREEAYRLALADDPEISEMLQKLAEATNEKGRRAERARRVTRALLERFNSIRTGRIYQQHVNIRTYKFALAVLLVLSVALIANVDLFVPGSGSSANPGPLPSAQLHGSVAVVFEPVIRLYDELRRLLSTNTLAFVFFSGLIGGFFSVVTRVRDSNLIPGEDAYFLWYVLSKPFVGALGAMVIYVLFHGGFVSLELIQTLGTKPSPKLFGFAFLAGFSERVAFPHFR